MPILAKIGFILDYNIDSTLIKRRRADTRPSKLTLIIEN
jgi:hypothetical protein